MQQSGFIEQRNPNARLVLGSSIPVGFGLNFKVPVLELNNRTQGTLMIKGRLGHVQSTRRRQPLRPVSGKAPRVTLVGHVQYCTWILKCSSSFRMAD